MYVKKRSLSAVYKCPLVNERASHVKEKTWEDISWIKTYVVILLYDFPINVLWDFLVVNIFFELSLKYFLSQV